MNVLVLCTGNSCRSQLGEGFLRHFGEGKLNAYSAGVETHGVNPRAIKVMDEAGIDISSHTSNHIDEYREVEFDYVITVCDHARETCPWFPAKAEIVHHSFPDPAKVTGTEEEIMASFRDVREQVRTFMKDFVARYAS